MLQCSACDREGPRVEFETEDDRGYVCPKCGMDESGLIAICETCGVRDSDLSLDDALHTNELCFK